jgi:glycosyltransferase involved in cell wall biosynthesis
MNITHWMKKENSGLARTTLELAAWEEKAGHGVCIRQPQDEAPIYGSGASTDVHGIHSQIHPSAYHDKKPKFLWCHGEPLSSVANGISMKAITDMAPLTDAMICMRKEEYPIWSSIQRTYVVPKGIDLERYCPLDGVTERLSGEPAVLYVENWRGQRNPLYLCVAMQEVYKRYPKARLHLFNCPNNKLLEMFKGLSTTCHWWPFLRTLKGQDKDVNLLYNRADIVVSCLYPLYARGIEAFGAGKAFIGPGYREPEYPWTCELDPTSMANAICACWENYDRVNYRQWAKDHHDVAETVRQTVEIYGRYC